MSISDNEQPKYLCPVCKRVLCTTVFTLVKHLMHQHLEDPGLEEEVTSEEAIDIVEQVNLPVQHSPMHIKDSKPAEKDPNDQDQAAHSTSNDKNTVNSQQLAGKRRLDSSENGSKRLKMTDQSFEANKEEIAEDIALQERQEDNEIEQKKEPNIPSNDQQLIAAYNSMNSAEDVFQCDYCPNSYTRKGSLCRHLKSAHHVAGAEDSFICMLCLKKYSLRADLTEHLTKEHEAIVCEICSKTFQHLRSLLRHKETVHEEIRVLFHCDQCSKGFPTRANLTRHVNTVHEEQKQFQCGLCLKRYARNDSLQAHIRHVHEAAQVKYVKKEI